MNLRASIILVFVFGVCCLATEPRAATGAKLTRFDALPGSKVILKGYSNVHDWTVEGTLLCGFIEVEPGFPSVRGGEGKTVELLARGEVFVPVRNLTAVGANWQPYNEQTTAMVHRMLHADEHPKIFFRLSQLETRIPPPTENRAVFLASGELVIAGVTNRVTLSLAGKTLDDGSIHVSGKASVKQSDFRIIPKPRGFRCFTPDTDRVEITFDWYAKETVGK